MATTMEVTCANRECRVAQTQRCVEGFELGVCPYYGRAAEAENGDIEGDSANSANSAEGVALHGADTLTLDEATRVLRSRDSRVIAIVGAKGAGKTSLIASLYDLLQEGHVNGAEYARSETLHAFELACHDARAASRRSEPDMERTPYGEVRFYHLDLTGGAAGGGLAFLLGDRAGEEYRAVIDDVAELNSLPEISRADTLTVLVDGQRLLDAGARHNVRSETIMMLQALFDGGALRIGQQLLLILTKFDAISSSPHRVRAESDFAAIGARVTLTFSKVFSQIRTHAIAASPKTGATRRGTGVATVLEAWADAATCELTVIPLSKTPKRAFARLQLAEDKDND